MSICLILAAAVCYVGFIWTTMVFFQYPDGIPKKVRIMGVSGAITIVFHLAGLSFVSELETYGFAMSLLLYVTSFLLFVCVWRYDSPRGN